MTAQPAWWWYALRGSMIGFGIAGFGAGVLALIYAARMGPPTDELARLTSHNLVRTAVARLSGWVVFVIAGVLLEPPPIDSTTWCVIALEAIGVLIAWAEFVERRKVRKTTGRVAAQTLDRLRGDGPPGVPTTRREEG